MNDGELTGQLRTHIVEVSEPPCALHAHVAAPFMNLRRAALQDGFDLVPLSGFRDFSRQLHIWNRKFTGEQRMLDAAGQPIDVGEMSPAGRIEAILL